MLIGDHEYGKQSEFLQVCGEYNDQLDKLIAFEQGWFEHQYARLIECTENRSRRQEVIFTPYIDTNLSYVSQCASWLLAPLQIQTQLTGEDVYSEQIDYADAQSYIKSYFDEYTDRERKKNFVRTMNFTTKVTNVNGDEKHLNFNFFTLCFYNALKSYWVSRRGRESDSGVRKDRSRSRERDRSSRKDRSRSRDRDRGRDRSNRKDRSRSRESEGGKKTRRRRKRTKK
jgi:hypothetical protein